MKLSYNLFILSICCATVFSKATPPNDDKDEGNDKLESLSDEIKSLQSGMENLSQIIERLDLQSSEENAKARLFSMELNDQHQHVSHEQIDCKQIEQNFLNLHIGARIQIEVCKMNITMHERLTEQCSIHVAEEQTEIAELNRLLAACQAEQTAINTLIAAEINKLVTCETLSSAIPIADNKNTLTGLLSTNAGIISGYTECQTNTAGCSSSLSVCMDTC